MGWGWRAKGDLRTKIEASLPDAIEALRDIALHSPDERAQERARESLAKFGIPVQSERKAD